MIHLMGIGGSGMAPLAELLMIKGYQVSGCDRDRNHRVDRLISLGIKCYRGHDPAHLKSVDRLIYSPAISPSEQELIEAREKVSTVQSRGEALQQELKEYKVVGIAGTHGKTTTTAMLSYIVNNSDISALTFLGGEISSQQSGLSWAESQLAILELDESDRMFLLFKPFWGVVSSMEVDHMGKHYQTKDQLYSAFKQYLTNSENKLVMVSDEMTSKLTEEMGSEVITCGQDENVDIYFNANFDHMIYQDRVVKLPVWGIHNYKNAALAITIGGLLGIASEKSIAALQEFPGVSRRNEIFWQNSNLTMISDYAHHPTEVYAAISTAKEIYDKVTVVFQPHLFSRTKMFASEFAQSLSNADEVLIMPIYPAREQPLPGVSSAMIADSLNRLGKVNLLLPDKQSLMQWLETKITSMNGVVILLGAGDVDNWRGDLVKIAEEKIK
ncbi:MAG: hypothetical protein APR63_08245 [Desulfuromonas sp. SDB]|nr:MAG: hypothetical protein APR63_08245 [Desulfuromonas sp. SDB]